jgi:XTP/dITP diphosphohydrolase
MEQRIGILTRNAGKLLAATDAFAKRDIAIVQIEQEYPEIQAERSIDVARLAALQAAKDTGIPVVREDQALVLNGLGGFPGPYMSQFERKIPVPLLLSMLSGIEDRSGHFEIAAALAFPDGKIHEFVYTVPVRIAAEPRGEASNWDTVLMLESSDKTFAEEHLDQRTDMWNSNFVAIADFLIQNNS